MSHVGLEGFPEAVQAGMRQVQALLTDPGRDAKSIAAGEVSGLAQQISAASVWLPRPSLAHAKTARAHSRATPVSDRSSSPIGKPAKGMPHLAG